MDEDQFMTDDLEQLSQADIIRQATEHESKLEKKQRAMKEGQEGVIRRGKLSIVQKAAEASGNLTYIYAVKSILQHANSEIEAWKNNGNIDQLEKGLSDLQGTEIRAVLDTLISPDSTIQQYFIRGLSE